MADLFTFLVETVFKISPQVLNQYTQMPVLEQVFYLLLFPTLFIIVFIYIMSNIAMPTHRGLKVLIAVSVYAFILLQGMYQWFVILSKYWLFGLIVLGAFWFITGKRNRGGGGGAQGLVKGKGGGMLNFFEDLTGKKINPKEAIKWKKMMDRDIKNLYDRKKSLGEMVKKFGENSQNGNIALGQLAQVNQAIATVMNFKKFGAIGDYEDWRKKNSQFLSL